MAGRGSKLAGVLAEFAGITPDEAETIAAETIADNDDGDWQFLDGGPVSEDAVVLHIHHVFDKHSDLRSLADLPEGWAAERDSVAGDWRRYPWQEPD
jgi:hypothetical protein